MSSDAGCGSGLLIFMTNKDKRFLIMILELLPAAIALGFVLGMMIKLAML